jgi:hypothetical protein
MKIELNSNGIVLSVSVEHSDTLSDILPKVYEFFNLLKCTVTPDTQESLIDESVPPTVITPAPEPLPFDSAGMVWDERIHRKKRTKNPDGTWKLLKGVSPLYIKHVLTESAKLDNDTESLLDLQKSIPGKDPIRFIQLTELIKKVTNDGILSAEQIIQIIRKYGGQSLSDVAVLENYDLLANVYQEINNIMEISACPVEN